MPADSYWEIIFYGIYKSQSRVYRFVKPFTENFQTTPIQNLLLNIPLLPNFESRSWLEMTASQIGTLVDSKLLGDIKEVSIRIGSVRNSTTLPQRVDLRIKHLWVSSMQPKDPTLITSFTTATNFWMSVYAMPIGKPIFISNYDSDSTRVILTPLKDIKF